MKQNQLTIPFIALAVALSLAPAATPAHADAPSDSAHPVVSEHLKDFKGTAFEMRQEAATLHSHTSGKRMAWQTHTQSLAALKQQVNDLGRTLAELEQLKAVSGETQQMAIENARTHLLAVAQNLTLAIEMVNENRSSIVHGDYADAVRNIQEYTASLYEKVDTLLDYEATRMRLDNLELQLVVNEGS